METEDRMVVIPLSVLRDIREVLDGEEPIYSTVEVEEKAAELAAFLSERYLYDRISRRVSPMLIALEKKWLASLRKEMNNTGFKNKEKT
ncbi:hypothetical protein NB640_12325 [Oxalobacter vibrioformis]|uniref:Uncharacterized protein n=1 Tax=Oxalobacter vibrioformis TaxID=933080 RepID=A0A9E9P2K2_9BURK|nr:hypothetical protein [Oxalobacter vibrioformis]WAW09987.1 hypothetical protein NB640_12325 [Oxalobacter vibrioformis]